MPIHVYTDGSAQPNPGHAAYGVVVMVDGRLVEGTGVYLGAAPLSNNVAEWRGVLAGLACARSALAVSGGGDARATLCTDSELVVKQLRGTYQVRAPTLVPLHREAAAIVRAHPIDVSHVLRARNALADSLANAAARRRRNVRLRVDVVDDVVAATDASPPPAKKRNRSK